VNGNELLHEQSQHQATLISDLEQQLGELRLKCEHLSEANSELNTAKCEAELRHAELKEACDQMAADLKDLDTLRECKNELSTCKQRLVKVEAELDEQRDLVEQLNEAKEFLAENNSKLLTNIIKIQLFVESMGLDHSDIDSVPKVRAYEEAVEK
jgi:chromosome segregation ATPase